jgi:hypothetical protein
MVVPSGFSRETTIRRTADGVWYHDGLPVEHDGVRRAFDAWVDRAENGRYILKNESNWAYVAVEGAPVFVLHARRSGDGIDLSLSDGRVETLAVDSLREDRGGMLYCTVRGGRLAARFTRNALMDLEATLTEEDGRVVMQLGEITVRWPVVDDPLVAPSEGSG